MANQKILKLTDGWTRRLTPKPRAEGPAGQSMPSPAMDKSINESRLALINRSSFGYIDKVFSVLFLSRKANARLYNTKSGHGPQRVHRPWWLHLSLWQMSHRSTLRPSQSGSRTHSANQTQLIPPINIPMQTRPQSSKWSVKTLRLTLISLR